MAYLMLGVDAFEFDRAKFVATRTVATSFREVTKVCLNRVFFAFAVLTIELRYWVTYAICIQTLPWLTQQHFKENQPIALFKDDPRFHYSRMIHIYAPLYAMKRRWLLRVKICIGFLSVPIIIWVVFEMLICRASYAKDPNTGVKRGIKVCIEFVNLGYLQQCFKMDTMLD